MKVRITIHGLGDRMDSCTCVSAGSASGLQGFAMENTVSTKGTKLLTNGGDAKQRPSH